MSSHFQSWKDTSAVLEDAERQAQIAAATHRLELIQKLLGGLPSSPRSPMMSIFLQFMGHALLDYLSPLSECE